MEVALLCEYWSRLARRDAVPKSFAFSGFTPKATSRKLEELEKILKPEHFELPTHCEPEEVGNILADCQRLATQQGRAQAARAENGFGTLWEKQREEVGADPLAKILPDAKVRSCHNYLVAYHASSACLVSSQVISALTNLVDGERVDELVHALRRHPLVSKAAAARAPRPACAHHLAPSHALPLGHDQQLMDV